jgi:large repetitive protein
VTVGSSGTWTLAYSPFYPGSHTVTVSSTLGADTLVGNTAAFTISPATNCAPTHVAPTLNQVNNLTLTCERGSISDILLSGIGTPGATITVTKANGTVVGSAQVNASGSWWVTSSHAFSSGTYTLIATSVL